MSVKVKDTMMPLGKWDFKNDSERRKKLNLLRYEALKRELLLLTAGIGTACSVYCFIQFSFEAALSYGVGVLFSCLYLQLLYYHSDNMTRDDVPEIFKQKKLKKIGIRSEDLKNTLEKTLNGCTMALSYPRLVIPAAIYGLWALSHNFVNDYFDFEVIDELNKSKKWSELHIADNCCFHFRRRLLFKMLEDISAREDDESCINQKTEVYFLWKEELEWNESLISRYIGREALWLHRRFLSQCYINYFTIDQGTRNSNGEDFHGVHSTLDDFLDKELELLLHSLDVTDNEFEDTQVQAQHATAYIIWISKQVPPHKHEKLQSRLQEMDLKPIMIKLCADKPHLCESPKLQLHWQHSGGIRQFIKTIVLGFELEPVQRNNSCILG